MHCFTFEKFDFAILCDFKSGKIRATFAVTRFMQETSTILEVVVYSKATIIETTSLQTFRHICGVGKVKPSERVLRWEWREGILAN